MFLLLITRFMMGKLCDRCIDPGLWEAPADLCQVWIIGRDLQVGYSQPLLDLSKLDLSTTWGKLRKSLGDARQKSVKRGTQHWSCNVPALLVWLDSASTSSDLISEAGSITDSDLRDMDPVLAAITPTQVVEVSGHQTQGSVEEPPAIYARQVPTLDNVIPVPLCAELITYAHAPYLASSSNQLLLTSAGRPAPLLVTGPSAERRSAEERRITAYGKHAVV